MTEKNAAKSRKKLKSSEMKAENKNTANKSNASTVTSNRLELLVTIVSRKKAEYYTDFIQSFDVNMQVTTFGHGTADAKMLVYLGLAESDKAVIFSVIQENKRKIAMPLLEYKFKTIKDGKGIAFTIPLSSVIGTLIFRFLSDNRMTV